MDTLSFEPERFHSPQSRPDEQGRIAAPNLSDVEVFMLRGRRLQAQVVGQALQRGLAKLRRLMWRAGAGRPAATGDRRG